MFKISYRFVVYRYEAILALVILLLTGSIAVSSKDTGAAFPPLERYPYSIALTFDDGPHKVYTERLMKILDEKGVKATFFIVGSQGLKFPGLLKELSDDGQEVESHTMTHANLKKLKPDDIRKELNGAQNLIKSVTGRDSLFFRPPGGQYDNKVNDIARELGLEMVLWTVFPKDHMRPPPEAIEKTVFAEASDGGVVLLHSGVDQTLEALPVIIDELRKKGYRFLTISELKKQRSPMQLVWLR
jgi:peptidoglycan/xylan/chitin deacetylase (PgdA/CDA1 family)